MVVKKKSEELQIHYNQQDYRSSYQGVKELYTPSPPQKKLDDL